MCLPVMAVKILSNNGSSDRDDDSTEKTKTLYTVMVHCSRALTEALARKTTRQARLVVYCLRSVTVGGLVRVVLVLLIPRPKTDYGMTAFHSAGGVGGSLFHCPNSSS